MNKKNSLSEVDYRYFKKRFLEKSSVDLDAYKPRQMQRRIRELSKKMGCSSLRKYWHFLEKNPREYEKSLEHITINFSEFFRDPNCFQELEERILPEIIKKTPNLRIWSAACATGEEPYSVAIILEEKYPQAANRILATDIDRTALRKAELGLYDKMHLKNASLARLDRYFIREKDKFRIKEKIKRRVKFKKLNLLKDKFPWEFFWLVLCRNVIIYLEDETKNTLIGKLHGALRRGGILFLGGTEKILAPAEVGFESMGVCFYRKI